jgi:methyl acetate hydrolase
MSELDDVIRTAVERQDMPFVVAMIGDRHGVRWSGSAGEAQPGVAAASDTIFRIYSMTKAVGCTAAMILMDRGKLDPDMPVAEVLPEFANKRVLVGFDAEGKPLLRPPRKQATVRHLATHMSGLTYEHWNSRLRRYLEFTGQPGILSGLREGLDYPLMFDPGDRWEYGIGIDWLGQVVERVDGRAIDDFCRDEIFLPLNMRDTCFDKVPDIESRLSSVRVRGEDGSFTECELAPPTRPAFYGMGHALYSTAPDYMRFLQMYLNKGQLDGCRLLSEAGLVGLLKNQIGDTSIVLLKTTDPSVSADAEFFPGRKKSHSMCFQRIDEDIPGMRSAGSQFWAGVCNTHFWFDQKKDVIGIIFTQMLPFAEPRFMRVYEAFERAVYRTLAE